MNMSGHTVKKFLTRAQKDADPKGEILSSVLLKCRVRKAPELKGGDNMRIDNYTFRADDNDPTWGPFEDFGYFEDWDYEP